MAAVLGLTMAFSFSACSLSDLLGVGGGDNSSNDGWENSSPNSPIEIIGEGAKYMEGIVGAVREANTISAKLDFEFSQETVDKTYSKEVYDEDWGESYLDDWNDTESMSASGSVTVTAAKAGETYSLSITGNVSYTNVYYDYDYESDNYETQIEITDEQTIPLDLRLVGNYAYMQQEGQWFKTPIDWKEVEMSLGLYDTPATAILSEVYTMLMEGDLTEVYNLLGPIFEQTLMLDIQNQKYEFELDIAELFNTAVEYLTTLDYTQTALTYFNGILAQEDTSVEKILGEIAAKGTMTVKEIYDEINKILVEKTGKDINGLKDQIVAKIDLNQFKDYVDTEVFLQLQQTLEQVSKTKIEELLSPYMSLTVNDLISMMYVEDEFSTPITLDMIKDQILAMLSSMTLEEMLGEEYFDALTQLQNLDLDELEENLSIQFNGYKISNLAYSADADFAYEDDETQLSVDMYVDFTLNLSQETTSIVAPEGAIEMSDEYGM